jgi:hypothetical protein
MQRVLKRAEGTTAARLEPRLVQGETLEGSLLACSGVSSVITVCTFARLATSRWPARNAISPAETGPLTK